MYIQKIKTSNLLKLLQPTRCIRVNICDTVAWKDNFNVERDKTLGITENSFECFVTAPPKDPVKAPSTTA